MTYFDLLRALFEVGYTRIERDDRLLDVLPDQTREKGVELWERWDKEEVRIVCVRLPFEAESAELFAVLRTELERLLQENKTAVLEDFDGVAVGDKIVNFL